MTRTLAWSLIIASVLLMGFSIAKPAPALPTCATYTANAGSVWCITSDAKAIELAKVAK